MTGKRADTRVASSFTRQNFKPEDWLAVVLINKRAGSVIQRIAQAATIAQENFQEWLCLKNAGQADVYISMNALKASATGRTKADIAGVRHVFLDLDEGGTTALEALLKRQDLPKPSFVVSSSLGKWQVLWKVEGFAPKESEALQRSLAREVGADRAATDCSRVLRLPGFYNHKYADPYLVGVEKLSDEICQPEHFPLPMMDVSAWRAPSRRPQQPSVERRLSQSERDWAFAGRALARGEAPEMVIAAIAMYRRFDKHNPRNYAERTVQNAAWSIAERRFTGQSRSEKARDE